jgi:hypothetical protein
MSVDTSKGGVKPGMTFPDMRAKARAGQLVKGAYRQGDCAGPGPAPSVKNAGQGTGIVQRTQINTSRTGNSPTERQSIPGK